MRVAFVIPSITAGGAERVVVRLGNYLADHGVSVVLFVAQPPDVRFAVSPAVTVVRLPALDAEPLAKAVRDHRIDVLSDHYHWSFHHVEQLAKLASRGIKIILSEHNSFFFPLYMAARECIDTGLDLYCRRPELYRNFAAVTTLNHYNAGLLCAAGAPNLVLIHNPTSYDTAARATAEQPRMLNVSSFKKPAKRIDRLFQVFAKVSRSYPGVRLRVSGDFSLARYQDYCRDFPVLPSSIEITGRSHDVAEHYLASSIAVLTSEIEGQPMVLIEAALHGLPQIAFDIPGLEDQILHNETGYIIERGDFAHYADCAVALLRDDKLRGKMGARAHDFVQDRFNLDRIGTRWLELLTDVHEHGAPGESLIWTGVPAEPEQEYNRWFRGLVEPMQEWRVPNA